MNLIVVDKNDNEIKTSEKHDAHMNGGVLHRSFSVLLYDYNKRMLIQQRSKGKYHTPLLWTNTCCSHPTPGESTENAVSRRMLEELGEKYPVDEVFSFTYKAELGGGMVEHEFVHVFFGICDDDSKLNVNPYEIANIKWVSIDDLCTDIIKKPDTYTPWFKIIMTDYIEDIIEWVDMRCNHFEKNR